MSQALIDIIISLAVLLSNVNYSAVVMNWDCWPQTDADTVSNMAAIADMLRSCGVLVIDRSQWYRNVAEPKRLFTGGASGHLKNDPNTIAFLTQTMVESEDLAFAIQVPPQAARKAANIGAVPKGTPVVYLDMQRDENLRFVRPGATFNEAMANPTPPPLLVLPFALVPTTRVQSG